VNWSSLPARNLGRAELEGLVNDLAAHPEGWRRQISFEAGGRHYVSLYRDDHLDVWLLCWTGGDDTGWPAWMTARSRSTPIRPRSGASASTRSQTTG